MPTKVLNPQEHNNWNQQIAELPAATIFHTANWARVLSESYGYRPTYFTAFQDGLIAGCLPIMDIQSFITGRRGVSLPFSDECRPVYDAPDAFHAVWQRAVKFGGEAGWRNIELRGAQPVYKTEPVYTGFFVHRMDLAVSEAGLLSRMRSSTKRNIQKAIKQGVQVNKSYSLDSVKAFYRLNCRTRKKHGLPPQPFKFFLKLHEHIIASKMGFILYAAYAGTIIAAAVFLQFKDCRVFKFGASNDRYQHLRANNLLMWEAIRTASRDGCRHFDFGRTERGNAGLLQFKRGWGAVQANLNYYRYDLAKNQFTARAPRIKSSYALFERLPMPLLKLSGSLLYRHVA